MFPRESAPQPASAPRVGYVLKMYPRFSETFVLNEILALEEQGWSLDVFSLRPPADGRFHERLADVRASVTYLPRPVKASDLWTAMSAAAPHLPALGDHVEELLAADADEAVAAVELAAQVRQRGLAHLHAHFGSVATTVARLAAMLAGVGYTFTAHAKDVFHEEVDEQDLRRKLADARAVVTVSDFNHTYLRERHGDAADRVVRVYNGLDLDRFAFDAPVGRPPVVLAVGRLVEKKGFTHLVDAMVEVTRRRPDARLDVVGTGDQEPALRAQVEALGLGARVRFLGAQPQARVREAMRAAAVVAAPCVVGRDGNRDGLPTVLLEALALGTPAVATPVTGVPEAVRDGETGLLVPEGDPDALAAAVLAVLDDPAAAHQRARAGRRLVEEHFDVRRSARRLGEVFRSAADEAGSATGSDAVGQQRPEEVLV